MKTSPAFLFVFTMGIVNLFADTTYEGGASINGPFMATLGVFCVLAQLASLPVFVIAQRREER